MTTWTNRHFNLKKNERRGPGFARIESYWKSIILNASGIPPYDSPADRPTEFYNNSTYDQCAGLSLAYLYPGN